MARRRPSVTFRDAAAETVERLAGESGSTVAEVVRKAVAREDWFQRTTRDGGRIYVLADGEMREVEFVG